MLPWFLRYYKAAGAHKIVVYLNSTSTDRSEEILKKEPMVELHRYETGGVLRDDIHRQMKDTIWKKDKFESDDWAIVVDCDEFIVGSRCSLVDTLVELEKESVTVPLVHGFNVLGDGFPKDDGASQLFNLVPDGISTIASKGTVFGKDGSGHGAYNKPCAFRPSRIDSMNYVEGAHFAKPLPKHNVERGQTEKLWLLHAKWAFGLEYVQTRVFNLSEENKKNKWGTNFLDDQYIRDYYKWAWRNKARLFAQTVTKGGTRAEVQFSQDWFSNRIPQWTEWFAPYKDHPIKGMEIGVFEGQSSLWLLKNILTHYESRLIAVDTFEGGADQTAAKINCNGLRDRYESNIAKYKEKVRIFQGPSQLELPKMVGNFDFIYVDGSHLAPDVLLDAVNAWRLLSVGGLLVFDDYAWRQDKVPTRCPYPAIDAFLYCFQDRYERLPSDLLPSPDLQVAVRKTHD